ncbi:MULTISPECIES: sensor histidine kinase [unclassified Sphingobacterium]|uniref:sensor histidine kinase n=1 Tax=unclassified Sphingobacterium TaxID=2609468 RepID=UPI0010525FF8|nr:MULTISPECIES: histidine kinase [unclassified Sphingobacterium]MCS3552466.1 hypothetical protein [Sphingobacterium sp. JUb21]TCR10772.1 histidine kinase [Sphingobacterium sp. JUb20]
MSLYRLPLKGLIRLNIIISILIATLIMIFLVAVKHDTTDILYRFIQGIVFTFSVSFGNLLLIRTLLFRNKKQIKFGRALFYMSSYLWTIISWNLVIGLYFLLTGNGWESAGGELRAYVMAYLAIFLFNTIVLLIQNLFIFQYQSSLDAIEKLQLQANVSEATNLLLRQQIQPHFLFNALATVKSLYKEDTKVGETYLVHLATFLRSSITNPKAQLAFVADEIAFSLSYLHMQKIRFGTSLIYEINISDQIRKSLYLPYFSLQPLIENALKHNDFTEDSPIMIRIFTSDGFVIVSNNMQAHGQREPSTGNGLFNIKERYRLLGDEQGMKITADGKFFNVHLKLLQP